MKKINIEKLFPNFLIMFLGLCLIAYPWFGNLEPLHLFCFALGMIGALRLIEFIVQKDKTDKENLLVAVASFLSPLPGMLGLINNNIFLPVTLLSWVCMMIVVKLVKLDYLHDRKLPQFNIKLYGFIIFIIVGIITSYSMRFEAEFQTVVIGFLVFIYGLMDFFKDYINNLMINNSKKVKNDKRK